MFSISRREFMKHSATLSAGLAAAGALPESKAEAAPKEGGDTLRVAVIGVNGRGMSHVGGFANANGCVINTICDCDEGVIGKAMKTVEDKQGKAPKYEKDLRRVMEDKTIDIVSIATPNHWHSLAAIWAMQSGKDVYVEKPVSHNVSEGRRMVEVARKTGRICQTGTQIRSMSGIREAMDFLHEGKLGTIKLARGLCYKSRGSIGKVEGEGAIPKGCDYDLWCGPAAKEPLHRKHLHYDWHWVWNTGNGDLGNQGIHQMDVARWALGVNELAKSAISYGGRFGYVDDGETANTQVALFDFGDRELIFEVRGLSTQDMLADQSGKKTTDDKKVARVGNVVYGTDGYLVCSRYEAAVACDNKDNIIKVFTSKGDGHFANFVKAVRSRKSSDLNADILEGHLSSALCHIANISHRLGTDHPFADMLQAKHEAAMNETLVRMDKHLSDNKVDVKSAKVRVGKKLIMDPKSETFPGDNDANRMLTREYRKGFEVPGQIA
jgi:predicted dehydrogenase